MKILLDDYTLALFEEIAHPALVGATKAIELNDEELWEAEEFLNEMMKDEEGDDELDDI